MVLIIIISGISLFIPFLHVGPGRLMKQSSNSLKSMLLAFLLYCFLCFLAAGLLGRYTASDILAVSALVVFFWFGYMEAFSMICRGFSLHIMADVYKNKSLSLAEINKNYAGGRGVGWLLHKRLAGLRNLRLVDIDGGTVKIMRPFGLLVGLACLLMKRVLRMGAGG